MEKKGKLLMRKYEFGKLLGQGNYAKVYHARNIASSQSVAIKVIDKEKVLKIGLIEQTKREISIMRLVKHPNVVQLYEVMATKTKIYIVMEYAKGGELFAKVANGRLKEELARTYFQQLISAVDFCHGNGVYHRDLKPENLLLDENGTLKVTDFGLSALHKSRRRDGLLHTTCGTPAYVAPEVVSRKGYDGAKADTWSCGVILFVLLAGHLPFHDSNVVGMYRKMSKGEYKCPSWFSSDVRKLLSRILDPNPSTRAPISKIRDNPWFRAGLCNSHPAGPVAEFCESGSETKQETKSGSETKQETVKPTNLNAFDIISLARGFNLSGLFGEDDERRKVVKFTSKQSAVAILVKFQELAGCLKLRTSKKEAGFLRLENQVSSIDVEIFEFTPSFHLVEMKTSRNGLVFQKQVKEEIRPVLEDIIWAWQG